MLVISPIRSNQGGNKREGNISNMDSSNFYLTTTTNDDFSCVNLLESIDFDDLFMGMHNMDGLPDFEMDPELLAEFSLSGGEEESSTNMSIDDNNNNSTNTNNNNNNNNNNNVVSPNSVFDGHEIIENNMNDDNNEVYESLKLEICDKGGLMGNNKILEEIEIQNYKKKDSGSELNTNLNSSSFIEKGNGHKKHKSSSISKIENNNNNNQGKRKTKVDWTPELHRRFVQAVEQLGVDKAVPSRILELMAIDCLTRHNIASHLQKYRSHRKHLLAREAEAASWTQKRQMYGVAIGGSAKGGANITPWPHPHSHPPTIGFPPPPPPPMTTMHHPFSRPLHVWGHPSMDPQTRMPVWPKQVAPPTSGPVPPAWTPHPPPPDPAFWHLSHHRRWPIPRSIAPGIPPSAMYRPEQVLAPPTTQSGSAPSIDPHPSKESADAALEDVLAKPWLPLPIGLKPPSMDTVFIELHRQGISKIPPSSSSSSSSSSSTTTTKL